jgi:hypothetical protein
MVITFPSAHGNKNIDQSGAISFALSFQVHLETKLLTNHSTWNVFIVFSSRLGNQKWPAHQDAK